MVTSVLPVKRVAPPLIDVTLCGCGVRIWLNGSLGRVCDWTVLITEISDQSARQRLDDIATEIKHLLLRLVPEDEIAWFYRGPQFLSRVTLSHRQLQGKDLYFGFCLAPVLLVDLELAAGGSVEL